MSAEVIPIAPARRERDEREREQRRRQWEADNLGPDLPQPPRPAA